VPASGNCHQVGTGATVSRMYRASKLMPVNVAPPLVSRGRLHTARGPPQRASELLFLERTTGFEPATLTLANRFGQF